LADQDDVWVPGRVQLMISRLRESGAALITSNFEWMDACERPLDVAFDGVSSTASVRHFRNIADIFIGKTNYFGCAMAFRRELIPVITPIPSYVESHDLWIALAANQLGSNLHIDDKTLRKRRHGNNATSTVSNRSFFLKLRSRLIFARSVIDLSARRRQFTPGSPVDPRRCFGVPLRCDLNMQERHSGAARRALRGPVPRKSRGGGEGRLSSANF
jgi:hypothetical protein